MVLEAVMIIVDSSESSRNGDYAPTRFDAQADAVNIVFQNVVQSNPESSVGLMSMGGKGPEVLVTLTVDQGKILDGLHRTRKKICGTSHIATSIQVATLALKHRQNKSQRQRIIVFVCSPVTEREEELVKLAKKMKKSNVNIDFVLFGDTEDAENEKKLRAFNDAVKAGEGSNMVVVPPSSKLLSDQLITSPILLGEDTTPLDGEMGDSGIDDSLGFDPSADPELALALRMSLEEETARLEKARREEEASGNRSDLESEEEDESEPLLDRDGSPDGSGKQGDKPDDSDKMDIS